MHIPMRGNVLEMKTENNSIVQVGLLALTDDANFDLGPFTHLFDRGRWRGVGW